MTSLKTKTILPVIYRPDLVRSFFLIAIGPTLASQFSLFSQWAFILGFLSAAVACLGAMYEKLGRMVGRSYEETVQILIKALKNAESQGRCEIVLTLAKVVVGLGCAGQFTTIVQPIYNLPLSVFHSFFRFALLSSFFPFCLLIFPTCHFFFFPWSLSFHSFLPPTSPLL